MTYTVESRACKAYGDTRHRIIFHRYFRISLFSDWQSIQGEDDGSLR